MKTWTCSFKHTGGAWYAVTVVAAERHIARRAAIIAMRERGPGFATVGTWSAWMVAA